MTNDISILGEPLRLPGGAILDNRIAKAAMSEGLADAKNDPTPMLAELYRRWSRSGAGLLLSGNFQVDRHHLERPGNVVVDERTNTSALAAVARAGRAHGAHFWAQLAHTGRQVDRSINAEPLAPSSVEIDAVRGTGLDFARPRAMTEDEIQRAIEQFATAAKIVKAAGFSGVELHAAHGYLFSQFLSPLTNRRTDRWGGSLENRGRFLIEAVRAVRSAVGPELPIGIKLNSSDFMVGGYDHADSLELVRRLNDESVDLLELSGGSLEQPKMAGIAVREEGVDGVIEKQRGREAYFLAFASSVKAIAEMPVMVTGGFRTALGMAEAIRGGELDVVGVGRPLIVDPETPRKLISGELAVAPRAEDSLNVFHLIPWFSAQMVRIGEGRDPDLALSGEVAAAEFRETEIRAVTALTNGRAP